MSEEEKEDWEKITQKTIRISKKNFERFKQYQKDKGITNEQDAMRRIFDKGLEEFGYIKKEGPYTNQNKKQKQK